MPRKEFGLGRKFTDDYRDRQFPMRLIVEDDMAEAEEVRTYRYWWTRGWWGDQGNTPRCVAYAWLHWAEDGPVTHEPRFPGGGPIIDPAFLYCRAQTVDEWPGDCSTNNYDGTSVRAGAKILQRNRIISSYWWANDVQDIIDAILYSGPVVVGTWWYRDMFYPDPAKDYIIKPGNQVAGGHAYVLNGVNVEKGLFRIKNSWGRDWGKRGFAYITLDDFATLLNRSGEACLAVEKERD